MAHAAAVGASSTSWVDDLVKEVQKIEKAEDKLRTRRMAVIGALLDRIAPAHGKLTSAHILVGSGPGTVRDATIFTTGPMLFPSGTVNRGGFFLILQGRGGGGSLPRACQVIGDDPQHYQHRFRLWDMMVWERMPTPMEVQ